MISRPTIYNLKPLQLGNYMRRCASGGQSLANAERGVEMCGFVGKIDTEFFITNVHLFIKGLCILFRSHQHLVGHG